MALVFIKKDGRFGVQMARSGTVINCDSPPLTAKPTEDDLNKLTKPEMKTLLNMANRRITNWDKANKGECATLLLRHWDDLIASIARKNGVGGTSGNEGNAAQSSDPTFTFKYRTVTMVNDEVVENFGTAVVKKIATTKEVLIGLNILEFNRVLIYTVDGEFSHSEVPNFYEAVRGKDKEHSEADIANEAKVTFDITDDQVDKDEEDNDQSNTEGNTDEEDDSQSNTEGDNDDALPKWRHGDEKTLEMLEHLNRGAIKVNSDQLLVMKKKKQKWKDFHDYLRDPICFDPEEPEEYVKVWIYKDAQCKTSPFMMACPKQTSTVMTVMTNIEEQLGILSTLFTLKNAADGKQMLYYRRLVEYANADTPNFYKLVMVPKLKGGAVGTIKTQAAKKKDDRVAKAKGKVNLINGSTNPLVLALFAKAKEMMDDHNENAIADYLATLTDAQCDEVLKYWDEGSQATDRFIREVAVFFLDDLRKANEAMMDLEKGRDAITTAFEVKFTQQYCGANGRFVLTKFADDLFKRKDDIARDAQMEAEVQRRLKEARNSQGARTDGDGDVRMG